jgi:hypothetical protein
LKKVKQREEDNSADELIEKQPTAHCVDVRRQRVFNDRFFFVQTRKA